MTEKIPCWNHFNGMKNVSPNNSAFGMEILVMLTSCLFQLVATSYFLLIDAFGDQVALIYTSQVEILLILLIELQDYFAAGLQVLWFCFHLMRLLLIVEPCHRAKTEVSWHFNQIELNFKFKSFSNVFFLWYKRQTRRFKLWAKRSEVARIVRLNQL